MQLLFVHNCIYDIQADVLTNYITKYRNTVDIQTRVDFDALRSLVRLEQLVVECIITIPRDDVYGIFLKMSKTNFFVLVRSLKSVGFVLITG